MAQKSSSSENGSKSSAAKRAKPQAASQAALQAALQALAKLVDTDKRDTVIDILFRALSRNGLLSRDSLLNRFRACGFDLDDGRVRDLFDNLSDCPDGVSLQDFRAFARQNFALLERVSQDAFIIPRFDEFSERMTGLFDEARAETGGAVADYIPQLARVCPEKFGLSVCSIDGQRLHLGDSHEGFCVQSTCKPINYALALAEHGVDRVHNHVGREPSGRSFNELALNDHGLPHNPMINAGAIMSCSLIGQDLPASDHFDHVMQTWSALCGGKKPG